MHEMLSPNAPAARLVCAGVGTRPQVVNYPIVICLPLSTVPLRQVFYSEFGRLMMEQPLIGFSFTTYVPALIIPYMLLLILNVFNRIAAFFVRSKRWEFSDDWDEHSPYEAAGLRLLSVELENQKAGRPLGLSISARGELLRTIVFPHCLHLTLGIGHGHQHGGAGE